MQILDPCQWPSADQGYYVLPTQNAVDLYNHMSWQTPDPRWPSSPVQARRL
jgi:hypothetical protein